MVTTSAFDDVRLESRVYDANPQMFQRLRGAKSENSPEEYTANHVDTPMTKANVPKNRQAISQLGMAGPIPSA